MHFLIGYYCGYNDNSFAMGNINLESPRYLSEYEITQIILERRNKIHSELIITKLVILSYHELNQQMNDIFLSNVTTGMISGNGTIVN